MSKFIVQQEVSLGWDIEEDMIVINAGGKPVMQIFLGEAMEANPEFVKEHIDECVNTAWLPKWKELFPPCMTRDDLDKMQQECSDRTERMFESLKEPDKLSELYNWAYDNYESHKKGTLMSIAESTHGEIFYRNLINKINSMVS